MSGNPYASRPTSSWGYWRGGGSEIPLAYGQGSGMGPANQGAGVFSQGQGPAGPPKAWEPTIPILLALVVAEMLVVGCIGRALERFGFGG